MPAKKLKPEQILNLLRKIDVEVANSKKAAQAAREAGICEQTYYRWRKEFGGLKLGQAKRLKELEKENVRLKQLVAELSLEKQVLRDVARGVAEQWRVEYNTRRPHSARGYRLPVPAAYSPMGAPGPFLQPESVT